MVDDDDWPTGTLRSRTEGVERQRRQESLSRSGKNWTCEMSLSRIHPERTVTERERGHQLATVDYASRTPSRAGTRNFSAKGESTIRSWSTDVRELSQSQTRPGLSPPFQSLDGPLLA